MAGGTKRKRTTRSSTKKEDRPDKKARRRMAKLNVDEIKSALDLCKELREMQVDAEVDIPSAVVVGDTSSGKSSVMSRLTGIDFPTGEDIVTTFATEVDMQHAETYSLSFKIRLAKLDEAGNPKSGGSQQYEKIDSESISQAFKTANDLMRARGAGTKLLKDVLCIELRGPEMAPLTVIDLPGLMQAPIVNTTQKDVDLSKDLINAYIRNPRTVMLTVIPASNDIVNQAITKMSRIVDPKGERTMGIVTKVDEVAPMFIKDKILKTMANEKVEFALGWHALKNKIYGVDEASDDEIDEAEIEHFAQDHFTELKKRHTGIQNLRRRVVQLVGQKLIDSLPDVAGQLKGKLNQAKAQLDELGDPKVGPQPQRTFLMNLAKGFEKLLSADTVHFAEQSDKYTTSTSRQDDNIKILQDDFAQATRQYGSSIHFTSTSTPAAYSQGKTRYAHWKTGATNKDATAAIDWVLSKQKTHGGSTFPGTMERRVATDLFRDLSGRWEKLADEHIDLLEVKCELTMNTALSVAAPKNSQYVVDRIMKEWIAPHLDTEIQTARYTLQNLAVDNQHVPAETDASLAELAGTYLRDAGIKPNGYYSDTYGRSMQMDFARFTAAHTLAGVRAYYDKALDHWIADIEKQITGRLLRNMLKALTSDRAKSATDGQVKKLIEEPDTLKKQRKALEDKVRNLEEALRKTTERVAATKAAVGKVGE